MRVPRAAARRGVVATADIDGPLGLALQYTSAGGAISALTNYTLTDWHVTIGVALVSATYTAYGGMATSILTDMVQGCVMFSLGESAALACSSCSASVSRRRWLARTPQRRHGRLRRVAVHSSPPDTAPPLCRAVVIGCAAGFHFSKTSASAIHHAARWSSVGFSQCSPLIIGVVASGLFDMTMWQRAYAAKSSRELWQASLLGALLIMPVMILFGISGIIGAVMNPADAATVSAAEERRVVAAVYPERPVKISSRIKWNTHRPFG